MQETRTAGPKPGHFHFSAGCSGLFSVVSSLFFGGFCRFIVDGQIFVVIVIIIVAVIAVQQALVFVQFLFAAAQVERSGSQGTGSSKQKRQDCAEGFIRPSRADIDNYIKSVLDGLNKVAYADDRYIYKIEAEKRYTEYEARTEITIENLE